MKNLNRFLRWLPILQACYFLQIVTVSSFVLFCLSCLFVCFLSVFDFRVVLCPRVIALKQP